ncbi:MAG: hypothetical protein LUF32_05410 [Clostridiales bacterium]|nr:hypothetical protein [Clostridiales bacterium]
MEITAQTYQLISLIGFILAAVFCVTAIAIWFKFGIWKVIGELSGRARKKRVEQMRKDNETSGNKQFCPMPAAMGGGKIATPFEGDFSLQKNKRAGTASMTAGSTEIETETDLLTGVLSELTENQTSLLNSGTEHPAETESEAVVFHMIQDIVIIHTGEAI